MSNTSPVYRAIVQGAVPLVPWLLRDVRQREAHRARLASPAGLERWAADHRDPQRPLAWFHAPSVGEGLQACAVMQALSVLRPDLQLIYTHYSPSAEEFAASTGVDWHGYLAYDRRADVERMLASAKPDILVFTKLDLWPELAVAAARRRVPVAMAAATVNEASSRLRWPARAFGRPGYAALDLAMAIADGDAERLAWLGCESQRIVVTGDPRVDSVLAVADAAPPPSIIPRGDRAKTLVAGSTWPADEAIILSAYADVLRHHPDARLILAPHDPTPMHVDGLDAAVRDAALPHPVRLSQLKGDTTAQIIIVDRTGVLSRLYSAGAMAWVGGGYGRKGLHSVLEPAAARAVVVTGPRDPFNGDARLLERAGALFRLPVSDGSSALAALWNGWLRQPATAEAAGNAGRAVIEEARGAAERSAERLATLLRR